jgi:HAE1 family hydrophobic/amphiphilic exporter-1/multidrug efflux pump
MGIYLQSGANALNTAKLVRARLDEMSKQLPQGHGVLRALRHHPLHPGIRQGGLKTLGEAALLVIAVVYLFLQNWRATLIPIVAVPVSLIGTFAGMWLFGFSINTLTLFAMVLAIGIVVDDAIVVLENVERLMNEQKMSPGRRHRGHARSLGRGHRHRAGAVRGVRPGGLPRRHRRQALPAVRRDRGGGGGDLRHRRPDPHAGPVRPAAQADPRREAAVPPLQPAFERFTRYTNTVGLTLRHGIIGTLVFLLTIGAAFGLLRIVPGSFVPAEDQGYLFGFVTLTDGASAQRTGVAAEQMRQRIMSDDIENIFFINGWTSSPATTGPAWRRPSSSSSPGTSAPSPRARWPASSWASA